MTNEFYIEIHFIIIPVKYPQYVPTAFPKIANNTPIGANDGLNAAATTDAEATPPTLACEATAVKKKGARTKRATQMVKIA